MISPVKTSRIEILESRITPAPLTGFAAGTVGTPFLIDADASTPFSQGLQAGSAYLVHVESGSALIFTTDLNQNGAIDFNEITGISVADGTSLTIFTDVHGDIVTNLIANSGGKITDSDGNAGNGRDGKVLLNSRINSITLRSLTSADVQPGETVGDHLALSTYTIFGNVYAGKGVGTSNGLGGIIIDVAGRSEQSAKFGSGTGGDVFSDRDPEIGSVLVGSAASGQFFNFGVSATGGTYGVLAPFVPPTGVAGGSINGIIARSGTADTTGEMVKFSVGTIQAGNGGFGAKGGDISNVRLNGDHGGYNVIAGNGGTGLSGGEGGSIVNFSDLGSVTSQVRIVSGTGGQGLTGAGGDGGGASFGNINIFGGVSIVLGNGGNGFTKGGHGASLAAGTFQSQATDIPFGLTMTGTMHNPFATNAENLGKFSGIDFNGDGFGDAVITATSPDQLVVVFGTGMGTFYDETAVDPALRPTYLDAPAMGSAVTVGDFDGDGRADIAVASAAADAAGSIRIFFSTSVDSDGNGTADQFNGFTLPRISTLPSLFDYAGNSFGTYYRGATPVVNLAAGDFDGDGVMDLAVVADFERLGDHELHHVLFFLKGDTNTVGTVDYGMGAVSMTSGLLYADFGTAMALKQPFIDIGTADDKVIMQAGHLKTTDMADALFYGRVGAENIAFIPAPLFSPTLMPNIIPLGKVDSNRDMGPDKITLVDATLLDFALFDLNNDGSTDLAALLTAQKNFMVTETGDGAGMFTPASGMGDNAGISLVGSSSSAGLPATSNLTRIVGVDADADGVFDDVALYDVGNSPAFAHAVELTLSGNTATQVMGGNYLLQSIANANKTNTVIAFDSYRPLIADATKFAYGNVDPTNKVSPRYNFNGDTFVFFPPFSFPYSNLVTNNGFFIDAGDGGDSIVGSGGKGGSLGGDLTQTGTTLNPALRFILPANTSFSGNLVLTSGSGGDGFKAGGRGGDISGVVVEYASDATVLHSPVYLIAGDGGDGLSGNGGKGGSVFKNAIANGVNFTAGDGGTGKKGGNGGDVLGNGLPGVRDTRTVFGDFFFGFLPGGVFAGAGGDGIKAGGNGGAIKNFVADLAPVLGGEFGNLIYVGGAGGNAVAGKGGRGGDVINSSPLDNANLTGPLTVIGGAGGHGISGGNGGNIKRFHFDPASQTTIPDVITFIAGNGGDAASGTGGRGGGLFDIIAQGRAFDTLTATPVINSVIAGNGGESFGGKGGRGGDINRINVTSTGGAALAAAGAGGAGLTRGGNGGNVLNTNLNAAQIGGAKVLVVAGDGGNASGSASGFGGKNGIGGNGGKIVNFDQIGSTQTHVDLIAGNGGNTINYDNGGSGVGKGGSVLKTSVSGDIGNIDPAVPIKAYNDIAGDYHVDITMADFIAMIADGSILSLTDAAGNVGLIAGAAGRVQGDLPADAGVNGKVKNLTAGNLMAMVAGGIDRISAVQAASGIHLSGIAGADKPTLGNFDFYDANGTLVSTPVPTAVPLGGALIDGYVVTAKPIPGLPVGGRVVVPS